MMPRTTYLPSDLTETQAGSFGRMVISNEAPGGVAAFLRGALVWRALAAAGFSSCSQDSDGAAGVRCGAVRGLRCRCIGCLSAQSLEGALSALAAVSACCCGRLLLAIALMVLIGLPATDRADRHHQQDEHRHDGKACALRLRSE